MRLQTAPIVQLYPSLGGYNDQNQPGKKTSIVINEKYTGSSLIMDTNYLEILIAEKLIASYLLCRGINKAGNNSMV